MLADELRETTEKARLARRDLLSARVPKIEQDIIDKCKLGASEGLYAIVYPTKDNWDVFSHSYCSKLLYDRLLNFYGLKMEFHSNDHVQVSWCK